MRHSMILGDSLDFIVDGIIRPTLTMCIVIGCMTGPYRADATEPSLDRVIVPGERVGQITWDTNEAELVALFGRENVLAADIDTGEGDSEPGTVIYPEDDAQRLNILWRDPETREHPRSIQIFGSSSKWKTDKGISLGMTLKELEGINTMPFRLFGFGHDGSGIVFHCGRGILKELGYPYPVGNGINSVGRKIWISLNPYGTRDTEPMRAFYKSVSGDNTFSSGHPAMQALNPVVDSMTVLLTDPKVTATPPAKSPLIVAFGDSTTAPREVNGEALRVYADVLREKSGRGPTPATIFNAGVGGNDTGQARARLESDVLAYEPDIAIIQFGLNDSCIDVWDGKDKPRVTREAYLENLRYFVETLRAQGCDVILMTPNPMRWTEPLLKLYGKAPFDVNDLWGFNLTNRDYAQGVRDLAKELEVPLVDVYQHFYDYDAVAGQSTDDLLLDGMHPNNAGHALIADWLLAKIEKLR